MTIEVVGACFDGHQAEEGQQSTLSSSCKELATGHAPMGKFEGDIIGVSYEDFDQSVGALLLSKVHFPSGLMTRSSVRNKHLLWENGEVPYEMSPMFHAQERQIIQRAIRTIEENSCIRFVPRTGQADYLVLSDEHG
ncbi:hypothetical protein D918_03342 [Trichuris suis]|nr:hypothetical protein D918_03342 [Trichuris suis]